MEHFKKGKGLLLLILAAAQFMVILDGSIVNVALSSIMQGLGFAPENLQWVVTAYILAFGGFLLLGGRAADLFGRKRIFLIGLIGFTLGSLLAGIAQNEIMMIVARAIQGITAAFMSPAALSIILTEYKEGSERNRALGVWGAVGAGGAAAGLILGGILTQYLGWRWDFIVNLPIGLLLVALTVKHVPAHHSEADHNHLDLRGAALITAGLMALVYGLTNAPTWGWTSLPALAWIVSSLLLLVAFVINERKAEHPLVDLTIFRIRNLTGANIVQLFITSVMMSMFFFVSLYMQEVLRFKPIETGLAFLPFAITVGFVATQTPKLIGKFGSKLFLVAGPLLMAIALFILSHIAVDGSYFAVIFPGLILLAVGGGVSFVSISVTATSGVSSDESGLASGLLNTAQQIGGALGLAILSGVAATAASHVTSSVAHEATVRGYHVALLVGCGFAILASLIALVVIKQKNRKDIGTPIVIGH